jgi:CheY-like chemotaxis protein/two-component sensor histidine kinase
MRTLVDDILDFAKMDSGALAIESAPVDLATVLPDLVSLWRVEAVDKGISLELELDDTLVPVMTDIVRLRQVIFNLLSNAVKFTTEGSVQVSAARVVADGAEQLVFAFHDTGVGIPAAAFETIFEPFRQLDTSTTRRFGGTGLGLAISRHLARALGGDITVDSVLGAGSTFSLRLPYVRAETAAASAAAPDTDRADRTRARLLIVGSNPIGRSMLRTRLDPHFDRCTACDVDEAAERVREGAPDLLLIDADGLEDDHLIALLDQLARVDLAVAVLGPAAMTVPASVLRAHGAADVIVKPVSVDRLVEALGALSPLEAALLIDDDINN